MKKILLLVPALLCFYVYSSETPAPVAAPEVATAVATPSADQAVPAAVVQQPWMEKLKAWWQSFVAKIKSMWSTPKVEAQAEEAPVAPAAA